MSAKREIRCYDYVNHPYDQVRDALTRGANEVFRAATQAATSRAHSITSALRIDIAGIEVAKEIEISINDIHEEIPGNATPTTRIQLEWKAAKSPHLFPFMMAELAIYPLTATETQLDFSGVYEPPLGPLGGAINAMVGNRIADGSVHRFISDVAAFLRQTLTEK